MTSSRSQGDGSRNVKIQALGLMANAVPERCTDSDTSEATSPTTGFAVPRGCVQDGGSHRGNLGFEEIKASFFCSLNLPPFCIEEGDRTRPTTSSTQRS